MKKYILEYNVHDEVIALLGREIPHIHLENISTIILDLYEEEYEAIKEAGYDIKEDIVVMGDDALCAVPPYNLTNTQTPPTTLFNYYNLTTLHAAGFRGAGVKVAMIDTGQHDNHHAAAPAVIRHDFTIGQTGVSIEPQAHGGRGCIHIGQTNLFTGTSTPGASALYGIAYECELHSMRIQEDSTAIYTSSVLAAIDYCIANNFHIINISLSMSSGLDTAIDTALAAGIIVVCASGNSIPSYIAYPASKDGVIAVNAWTTSGTAGGSYLTSDNHTGVTVTMYNTGHTTLTGGTSQSAFMLTGILAIYKQKYPSLNTSKATNLLKRKALKIDDFVYDLPSYTNTRGVLENYQTGAGFVAPLY